MLNGGHFSGETSEGPAAFAYHLDLKVTKPDPNRYKLARLEVIDPWRLAELAIKDPWALAYLNALREIAQSSGADWKHRISYVRKFGE